MHAADKMEKNTKPAQTTQSQNAVAEGRGGRADRHQLCSDGAELVVDQRRILAARPGNQLIMRAVFHNTAAVHDGNDVCVLERCKE